jgi:hypothetical protein
MCSKYYKLADDTVQLTFKVAWVDLKTAVITPNLVTQRFLIIGIFHNSSLLCGVYLIQCTESHHDL